jgi:hypothetical protein
MAASWLLVEVYAENGANHSFVIEGGLTEEEAKSTAAEFRENMRLFGITGHTCEAVPDPASAA